MNKTFTFFPVFFANFFFIYQNGQPGKLCVCANRTRSTNDFYLGMPAIFSSIIIAELYNFVSFFRLFIPKSSRGIFKLDGNFSREMLLPPLIKFSCPFSVVTFGKKRIENQFVSQINFPSTSSRSVGGAGGPFYGARTNGTTTASSSHPPLETNWGVESFDGGLEVKEFQTIPEVSSTRLTGFHRCCVPWRGRRDALQVI